jgi:hypothetical protein
VRARLRKADQAEGGSLSKAWPGFTESRISTHRSTTATSTQAEVSHTVLLRQVMHGSLKSATRSPSPRRGGTAVGTVAADTYGVCPIMRRMTPKRS